MDIINQLELFYANMTKSERHAAEMIMKNMTPLAELPIKQAATAYSTSSTTLVRLAKRIGLSGYSEFSFQIKNYITAHQINPTDTQSGSAHMERLMQSFIDAFKEMISPEIESGVDLLARSMHDAKRIIAVGIGHSGLAAEHLKYLMLGHGLLVDTIVDEVLVNRLPPLIKSGDLIIVFSSSASIDTYRETFKRATKKDVTLALVTMNPNAPVLTKADVSIVVPMVHSTDASMTEVKYIDSRPIFYVLVSCLTRYYSDEYPDPD